MRGDAMPPGDVLLAVARSVGMSIDEQAGRPDDVEQPADRLENLERQVAELSEVVRRLEEETDTVTERRAERARQVRRARPSEPIPGSRPTSRGRGI